MSANDLTGEQMREVPCIRCDAKVGEPCRKDGSPLIGCHNERAELRAKFPVFPIELDSTDKSLICMCAYVMLCDSVSTKSVEVMGKQVESIDIQKHFAAEAIAALRKEGLIK